MSISDGFLNLRLKVLNLKRINGLPFSKKLVYLVNTLIGESLRMRTIGSTGLRLVEIGLTESCNCKCLHCYAANKKVVSEAISLTRNEVLKLLDNIVNLGAMEVCFTGGEPLLHADIVAFVQYAHQKGLVTRLISNGILLDKKMVEALKNAGLNWCSVSIDGHRAESHDKIRGHAGCFDKAMNALNLLVDYSIPCSMVTVARKEIIRSGELEKIVLLGKSIGCTVVRINFPVPMGRFQNQQTLVLNRQERDEVRKLLRFGMVSMESPREGTKCTASVTKININPNGDVTPCVFVPRVYGNIRQHPLDGIYWDMENFANEYLTRGQCPMCDPILRQKLYESNFGIQEHA